MFPEAGHECIVFLPGSRLLYLLLSLQVPMHSLLSRCALLLQIIMHLRHYTRPVFQVCFAYPALTRLFCTCYM